MFDVSSIKTRSIGGAKYWLLVMDDATGFTWSYFLKKKSEVPMTMVKLIKHLKKSMGYETTMMRCDNAGENLMTEIACTEEGLGINFEFTAVYLKLILKPSSEHVISVIKFSPALSHLIVVVS